MDNTKISIIIRTCGRPLILKKALDSVHQQTYQNIEVIIVEDSTNKSEELIHSYGHLMDIKYYCTGKNTGRCHAGNIGLEHATGEYFNFLDDDDILLPNHVELLVKEIKQTGFMAVYAIAEEHQIRSSKKQADIFYIKRKFVRYQQPYNKLLLFYMNYIPIQSIMFHRSLYEQYGGLDENLNVLEDWDMWVRYSSYCDFGYVPQITSIYYTPYKCREKSCRDYQLKEETDKVILKYQKYCVNLSVRQINQDMDYILNIFNKKGFLFYLQKVRNYLLYRDR